MQNDPTLRDAAQAVEAWLTAWLHSLGDIRLRTIGTVLFLVAVLVLAVGLLVWLAHVPARIRQYHALGYPWLRAFRLAQGDFETAYQQKYPSWTNMVKASFTPVRK